MASDLTQAQQVRLESVRLAYRHDRTTADITTRATDLSDFVMGKAAGAKAKATAPTDGQVLQDSPDPI